MMVPDFNSSCFSDYSQSENGGIYQSSSFERAPSFERRKFEFVPINRDVRFSPSKKRFKHLGLDSLTESREIQNNEVQNKEKTGTKHKIIKRSSSTSPLNKKANSHKKLSKTVPVCSILKDAPLFSERQLLQPITPRSLTNSPEYRKTRAHALNLDNFLFIDESKELQFNKELCKKLNKPLEALTKKISLASDLDKLAYGLFEKTVTEKTKSLFDLTKVNSIDLSKSERDRAQLALIEVLKNAKLISEIIDRLMFLKNSIYHCLTKKIDSKEKKSSNKQNLKSTWIDLFFTQLENLIASYTDKKNEMNPIKTFTYRYERELTDAKMHKFVLLCLKIDQKEFESILKVLHKWSDFKQLTQLEKSVGEIDRSLIKEQIDGNYNFIAKQKHEWFESLDPVNSFSQITIQDIVQYLKPNDALILTVNKKDLIFKKTEDPEICQINFLSSLMTEIYLQGFDPTFTKEEIREQALLLVSLEKVANEIRKDFNEENLIPWTSIQKKLSPYRAVPFMKLKKLFDKDRHLDSLDQFLAELSIPCFNVLKICTPKCWQRAHACIFALFTALFQPYGQSEEKNKFQTRAEKGIKCDITVGKSLSTKSMANYFITQIKEYETYPFCKSSLNSSPLDKSSIDKSSLGSSSFSDSAIIAKTIFEWTLYPFFHKETAQWFWKGILKIPLVETNCNISPENKTLFLKILQHPNIIDFVENDINGDPKIISTFST